MMLPSFLARQDGRLSVFGVGMLLVASSLACQRDERAPGEVRAAPAPAPAPAPPPEAATAASGSRAAPALASDVELSYFRVRDVAPGDVLNIRSEPDSNARLRGSIAPGAAHVEGIGAASVSGSTRWQRVRHGGTMGWVNARFLVPDDSASRESAPTLASSRQSALLAPLTCFGTEPFWGIRFGRDGSARCEAMCEGPPGLRLANVSANSSGEPESFDLSTPDQAIYLRAAMRKTGQCSDGMSDLLHPYEFEGVGKPGALSGCCRIEGKANPGPRP